MSQPTGDDSETSENEPYFEGYTIIPREEWVMTEEDLKEQEIQVRMYREAARAVREEVEWLEKHNFPIWILHEDEIVDARTLPDDVRAKNRAQADRVDLTRPAYRLRPNDPPASDDA